MNLDLTAEHLRERTRFQQFADSEVGPFADRIDREEAIPAELIARLAEQRLLMAGGRREDGGMDAVTFGLLNEELGRVCSSVRSLVTVQGMVAQAIARWGTPQQRNRWLPRLHDGRTIGAFALTEANAGSDIQGVQTRVVQSAAGFTITGVKKWISFGQIADLFLVIGRLGSEPVAFLVERAMEGVSIEPIHGLLGDRGAMLATVSCDECYVDAQAMLGRRGFGLSHVASTALDCGRYSVAWGCVGIAQACLADSVAHASTREQFGVPIGDHQLIRRLLTRMHVDVQAARLLCLQAGRRRDRHDPQGLADTLVAKYFASRAAARSAADAVQIHGAVGCSHERRVERYYRDAKITELIEGSTQIQELLIGEQLLQTRPTAPRAR
jgi:glutaryl-CoA dehydrogenase (non-decarboxylating)